MWILVDNPDRRSPPLLLLRWIALSPFDGTYPLRDDRRELRPRDLLAWPLPRPPHRPLRPAPRDLGSGDRRVHVCRRAEGVRDLGGGRGGRALPMPRC